MVRFTGEREEERWTQLINPGCRIPGLVSQLTGITDAMVAGSPGIQEVLPKVKDFVGEDRSLAITSVLI